MALGGVVPQSDSGATTRRPHASTAPRTLTPAITVVVPAHDEAATLPGTVTALVERLAAFPAAEVVVVENGSTDDTYAVADGLALRASTATVTVRATRSKPGLGAAYRRGIEVATGDTVLLSAADLPFGTTDVDAWLAAGRPRFAIGSKSHPDSVIDRPVLRRVLGAGFRRLRSAVLSTRTADTQGTVFLERTLAEALAHRALDDRFLFTTEITALAEATGVAVVELPVVLPGEQRPSSLHPLRDGITMAHGLLAVRRRVQAAVAAGWSPPERSDGDQLRLFEDSDVVGDVGGDGVVRASLAVAAHLSSHAEAGAGVDDADAPTGWRRVAPLVQPVTTVATVTACVVALIWLLQPQLLLSPTTPTGGDNAAHVWGPWFLREELLPRWRITGWSDDWYSGFPVFRYYLPLPSLLIVALDAVVPFGVAFKLVAAVGAVTLPVAAYVLGRSLRLPHPIPPLFAVGALGFLLIRPYDGFQIYGGSLASQLVGLYHYAIGLSAMLVFLATLVRACRDRTHRMAPVFWLFVCAMAHVIPAMVGLLLGMAVLVVYRGPRLWRWLLPPAAVFGLLVSWWVLPFLATNRYATDGNFDKLTTYLDLLFPATHMWVTVLAVIGAGAGIKRYGKPLLLLGSWWVLMALAFRFVPKTRLWNGRLIPFFYLFTYLLAIIGAIEVIRFLLGRLAPGVTLRIRHQVLVAAVVGPLFWLHAGIGAGIVPFTRIDVATGERTWMGLSQQEASLRQWARWNHNGLEETASYPEYRTVVDTMDRIGRERGCGRALFEYDDDLGRFGSPMALDLLPMWTDGCIDSSEGLFIESSATSPFHFLTAHEASMAGSGPVFYIPYRGPDLSFAVPHMRLLGIRYYMASSPELIEGARARGDLTEIATAGAFVIFELTGNEIVTGIDVLPIVDPTLHEAPEKEWLAGALTVWDPVMGRQFYKTGEGPDDWPRAQPDGTLPTVDVEPVVVSDITQSHTGDRISFRVDRVGDPVLVKMSWFPNWEADGALGPYRITPNLMVVVPTQRSVELSYGTTGPERLGWTLTALGAAAAGLLVVLDGRRRRRGSRAALR